jgi:hypothetical protein
MALWLREVHGVSYKEIARYLKRTPKQVENLLHTIRHNKDFMDWLPPSTGRDRRRIKSLQPSMATKIRDTY